MSGPFAELVALMESTEIDPSQDKLDKITEKMREARDLKLQISELENNLKEQKKLFLQIVHQQLPDMMNEVSQGTMTLLAEGNHPAYRFNLKPYYKANISNEESTAPQAYRWLEDHGEGDIIKRTVSAQLGADSEDTFKEITTYLENLKVDYDTKFGVPWNTLTSWLKERHAASLRDDSIEMPPLDIFGATIGQVADMKEAK
jgi:hypothetical protein